MMFVVVVFGLAILMARIVEAPTIPRGVSGAQVPQDRGEVRAPAIPVTPVLGGAVATVAGALAAGPAAALVVGFAAILWLVRERRASTVSAAVDVLGDLAVVADLAAAIIAAGISPAQALQEVAAVHDGTIGPGLRRVSTLNRRGRPFELALDELTSAYGPAVRPFIELLRAPDRHGVAIAADLGDFARNTRAARARAGELAARQLPIKLLFPLVVCILPAFVLVTVVPVVAEAIRSFGT